MDMTRKNEFMRLWTKHFDGAELPIVFYYTDKPGNADPMKPPTGHRCIFADLSKVRAGQSLCFTAESIGCFGGRRYTGFDTRAMPNFEYFLSCGIPGKLEGERYKKTPALVTEWVRQVPKVEAPARFIVFKRWDRLEEPDEPEVVVFFARPDVLSGLFTLANFDVAEPNGVFAPFGAGCASAIQYPYLEGQSDSPRAVLGLFDVSARPFVGDGILTFAVPMKRFEQMMDNMEESFPHHRVLEPGSHQNRTGAPKRGGRPMTGKRIRPEYIGTWHFTEMETWDTDYINLTGPGYLKIDREGHGSMHFGAVEADLDCRAEEVGDKLRLEFSFQGVDEGDPVFRERLGHRLGWRDDRPESVSTRARNPDSPRPRARPTRRTSVPRYR